ncbi:MAG TPA: protein kinase [Streptosporangiaceae bacterium]|nr:protein kinase [Streptosporangiaceae bacterium]
MARSPLQQTDPARVGRYRLTARLGAGGMGVVYLGETQDRYPVAIKVLRPELADNPEFRTRFGREVAALTRVRGVCTVRVVEADTEAPTPFLVTEYADGPSLSEYVNERGPLDPQMLYGLATGLAEALTAIHAAGIVHRDLKPSNVLLTATGPKVIDFGIAQALDAASMTRTGITVGSAGYIAPEQITGRAGTPADIFTWAVTVAFAASGQSPFGTGTSEAMLWRIMNQAPDIAAVPPGLRPLVEAALAKDPQARPTAPQLLAELTRGAAVPTGAQPAAGLDNPTQTILAQNWHPAGPTAHPGYPAGPRNRRRGALLPVILALAFVLAAAGTALGLTLAGRHGTSANAGGSGASSPASTQPAQVATSSAASTGPATVPASSPASTAPASTPATTPATSPANSATTTAPAQLPLLTVGSYTGMKPTEIAYSGDSTNIVSKIKWTSWTATGATGEGTSDINSCNPNCAQAPVKLVPATVTLSDPVDGKFTKMTETRNGFTSTYTYPDNWPEGAS